MTLAEIGALVGVFAFGALAGMFLTAFMFVRDMEREDR